MHARNMHAAMHASIALATGQTSSLKNHAGFFATFSSQPTPSLATPPACNARHLHHPSPPTCSAHHRHPHSSLVFPQSACAAAGATRASAGGNASTIIFEHTTSPIDGGAPGGCSAFPNSTAPNGASEGPSAFPSGTTPSGAFEAPASNPRGSQDDTHTPRAQPTKTVEQQLPLNSPGQQLSQGVTPGVTPGVASGRGVTRTGSEHHPGDSKEASTSPVRWHSNLSALFGHDGRAENAAAAAAVGACGGERTEQRGGLRQQQELAPARQLLAAREALEGERGARAAFDKAMSRALEEHAGRMDR